MRIRKFESFDLRLSKEEMVQKLCNYGWEKDELEMMDDSELQDMCKSLPDEMSESVNEHQKHQNYMFFKNVENIRRMCDEILSMDESEVDIIMSEHGWALDHMATSKDDVEEVHSFLMTHSTNESKKFNKKRFR